VSIKILNEYAGCIDEGLYEKTPKAVLAAIAVSFISSGGDHMDDIDDEILKEWRVLYLSGIVPQRPPEKY
jgi:hypothetical protein